MEKKEEKKENFTPMVEQYLSFKKQYGDIIMFFRVGDFYEMFLDDAQLASRELQLFLTKKASGNGTSIPMCGIPHHAYLSYAQKLIDKGYKVAICEQVEDPKLTKKLVKRDVIQIITPGVNLDVNTESSNYIASIAKDGLQAFISYGDVTTGEIYVISLDNSKEKILEKLLALDIKELVLSTSFDAEYILYFKENSEICISYFNDSTHPISDAFIYNNLNDPRQIECTARLFNYLKTMERKDLTYFKPAKNLMDKKNMKLDYQAVSNMELVKALDGKNFGSLYWLLNKTKTPMGGRYLKSAILSPTASFEEANRRQNLTAFFVENYLIREKLRAELENVFDMERLITRMSYESANGHDMLQLKKSLQVIPTLKKELEAIKNPLIEPLIEKLGDEQSLVDLLERAISEDCPITVKEGEIFKAGYDSRLDELIELTGESKQWIQNLEAKEKERTGIKTLHVGYNSVFGYYIEVSQAQLNQVKDEYGYIRKQTIKTGERFITPELKEREDKILRSKEQRMTLEYNLFKDLRKIVSSYTPSIQKTSDGIAELDFFLSLAFTASENNYVKPVFTVDRSISITDARHPIIEAASPEKNFVLNDYHMATDDSVVIITGPNMGGKSTYMKEFGLIAIMAQMGSFVPASSCSLPLFDALYTRIGASDNLIKGQSTFMMEMSEVSQALLNATDNSLFLFDEIGRGTATYDGMAIAQAIIEYIVSKIGCKTFFSTHYHEITKLSEKISGVKNIHCAVTEENGEVTFLYKMIPGSMDRSYGINVAKLAQLPDSIVKRADTLLESFENQKLVDKKQVKEVKKETSKSPIEDELKRIEPLAMSPLDALNYLINLKKRLNK